MTFRALVKKRVERIKIGENAHTHTYGAYSFRDWGSTLPCELFIPEKHLQDQMLMIYLFIHMVFYSEQINPGNTCCFMGLSLTFSSV